MPAHYTHSLYLFEALSQMNRKDLLSDSLKPWLILGAQGPDMFYHGLRTKPSAIALGSLLHRHSYGSFCANLLAQCIANDHLPNSPLGAYTLGFISHGILDRHLHPFINYFSGWQEQGKPETEQYRYAHSFYERIIDIEITLTPGWTKLKSLWNIEALGSRANFGDSLQLGPNMPTELLNHIEDALVSTYPKLTQDSLLSQRIQNSYSDSMGFYSYCDTWLRDQSLRTKKDIPQSNHSSLRWLSIVHPKALPRDLDFLNQCHESWIDPCGLGEETTQDLWDLYNLAVIELIDKFSHILLLWEHSQVSEDFPGVGPFLGDSDLRNNHQDVMLCQLTLANPKPIRSVLEQLISGVIPEDWQQFY